MKKKLLVFVCVAALLIVCTMAVAAEDGEGEKLWDFWGLLSASNVNYLGVIGMLITSLFTMLRMFNGLDGIKSLFSALFGALKNIIPGSN